jgi:hypothetical protein
VLPLVLLGWVAAMPLLSMAAVFQPGTSCKHYNAYEAPLIDYLISGGVRSKKLAPTQVICPLLATGEDTVVYVNVWHNGVQTTSCQFIGVGSQGTQLVNRSVTGGSGLHDILITLYFDSMSLL